MKFQVAVVDKSHSQHPTMESKQKPKTVPLKYIWNSRKRNPFDELHSPSDEINAADAVVQREGHVRVQLHVAVDHPHEMDLQIPQIK